MYENKYNLPGATLYGCAVGDNACTNFSVRNVPPSEAEYKQIIEELEQLKCILGMNSADYSRLEKIQNDAKKRDWSAVRSSVIGFLGQFSSATLANLVSGCLGSLLFGL